MWFEFICISLFIVSNLIFLLLHKFFSIKYIQWLICSLLTCTLVIFLPAMISYFDNMYYFIAALVAGVILIVVLTQIIARLLPKDWDLFRNFKNYDFHNSKEILADSSFEQAPVVKNIVLEQVEIGKAKEAESENDNETFVIKEASIEKDKPAVTISETQADKTAQDIVEEKEKEFAEFEIVDAVFLDENDEWQEEQTAEPEITEETDDTEQAAEWQEEQTAEPEITDETDDTEHGEPEIIEETDDTEQAAERQEEQTAEPEVIEETDDTEQAAEPEIIEETDDVKQSESPDEAAVQKSLAEEYIEKAYDAKISGDYIQAAKFFETAKENTDDKALMLKIDIEIISCYMLADEKDRAADKVFETLGAEYDLDKDSRKQIEEILINLQKS